MKYIKNLRNGQFLGHPVTMWVCVWRTTACIFTVNFERYLQTRKQRARVVAVFNNGSNDIFNASLQYMIVDDSAEFEVQLGLTSVRPLSVEKPYL